MVNQETNESGNGANGEYLGDFLKQKRLEKNYSLEKLSQKTKISINVLKSLEANDYAHLPSAAYIKGFVANYIKILAIPKEEAFSKMEHTYHHVVGKPFPALNHTKQMKEAEKSEVETTTPHEVIENSNSFFDSTKSMLPVAIFVAVILVFVGGYKLISSVVESEVSSKKAKDLGPKIESSSALGKLNEPQEDKKEVVAVEENVATPSSAPKKEATPAEEPKVEQPKPEIRRNFPTVSFKKIRSKLYTVNTSAPENTDPYLLPDNIRKQMNPELQNVYVAAIEGNTWLSYKIDNKPIESHIISQGGNLFLQGEVIRIFLGNVNVTKIFYNNYLVDTPSKSGVKSLVFPEERNAEFHLPLFPKAKDDILYTSEEYMKRMKLEEEELEKKKN